jgi:NAD(P)-dependent dehydrogenase (short-subunit alcohol dehydrogenase family)
MASRPLGRLGDPEQDIAPVAVFLASDDARFVTGEIVHADGGAHLG